MAGNYWGRPLIVFDVGPGAVNAATQSLCGAVGNEGSGIRRGRIYTTVCLGPFSVRISSESALIGGAATVGARTIRIESRCSRPLLPRIWTS